MWSEGVIGIPDAKDKKKYTKCHYWVKHYAEPSEAPSGASRADAFPS